MDDITSFNISNNGVLKRIVIGYNCFGKVRVFDLNGLSELESVVIGKESFMIDSDERNDGSYRIVNCPKLKSIQIGNKSFQDYHSFELSNLNSLQSIDIGERGFFWTPLFSLTGLIDLIGLNSQIFLNYNQLDLVILHSIIFNRLCLRVIEWMN